MPRRTRTDLIVFHCSATRATQNIGATEIDRMHRDRGFDRIGYHFVIKRDGSLEQGRELDEVGAHVQGHNSNSVGVCMVGGLDEKGNGIRNDVAHYTPAQISTARVVVAFLRKLYPSARVTGHRDLSPDTDRSGTIEPREWLKTCPGFDAAMLFAL